MAGRQEFAERVMKAHIEVVAKPRDPSKTKAAQVVAQEAAQLSLYPTKALQQTEAVRSLKQGTGKDSPASGSKALKTTAIVTGKTKVGSKTPSAKVSETKLLHGDEKQSSRRERAGEAAAEPGSKTQEKTSKLAVKPKVHSKTPAASRKKSERCHCFRFLVLLVRQRHSVGRGVEPRLKRGVSDEGASQDSSGSEQQSDPEPLEEDAEEASPAASEMQSDSESDFEW